MGEVGMGERGMNGDGRRLDLGWDHSIQCADAQICTGCIDRQTDGHTDLKASE